MKFLSVVSVAALSASNLVSAGGWFGTGGDVSAKTGPKVPGDSPLEFCDSDLSRNIVRIDKVDLSPNPPEAGSELAISASGSVLSPIYQGAYIKLVVKYGLIRLLTTTADLCEQVENVDIKCPIEKGDLSVKKTVEIPGEIPPGTYTVYADVYNDDETPITCLQATVQFGGKKSVNGAEVVEEVGDL